MNRLSFSVFIQFVLFTMGFSFIKQRPQSPLPFIESPKSNGTQLSSNLYINEFMASNVLAYPNNEGNYEDWIEIYNSGDAPVDLAGYFLTDNTNSNNYWKIPAGNPSKTTILAKGYLIFYADEQPIAGAEHLAFKLNKEGGQICLIDKDGLTLLDNLIYQKQVRDISFGRYPDGSSVIGYFAKHTPAASNTINYLSIASSVRIDRQSGFYPGEITVSIQGANADETIRYTIDGADPTYSSLVYSTPVQVMQTSVFKARAFKTGNMSGQIDARTFFINTVHTLPVIVLMTDPRNLYDPLTGIYVNDKDGREWERYAELEYFKDHSQQFHVPAGLRIQGNTGPKDFEKKSFRAYFRDGYGQGRLPNTLYRHDSVSSFNRLVFRAGYDDSMLPGAGGVNTKSTLLRDPIITELWRQTGQLTSQSSFAVLYLNEKFNGIYDIKESIDENFVMDHLGYQDLDMIRTRFDSTELVFGSRDKWNQLVKFYENNTFISDEKIDEAARMMDLDNFITLQALTHGAQYSTWSYGTFMYRQKTEKALWKWTIWDADKAMKDENWNGFLSQSSTIGTWIDNLITKKLLKNSSFRNKYINRLSDLLNTVFIPRNVKSIIDSLAQCIAPEIPGEVNRWDNTVAKWNENVEALKDFADRRPSIVTKQMQDYFQLGSPKELTISVQSGKGKIILNSLSITQFPWTGKYFSEIPVTITAVSEPGYRFTGWSDPLLPANEVITISLSENKSIAALFEKLGNSNAELIAPKRIKRGQYLPIIVRLRDSNWEINPVDQTPMQVKFNQAHIDTVIKIKRGAGTGLVQINSDSPFTLVAQTNNISAVQKLIKVSDIPIITYSGTLPVGTTIWDNSSERVILSDLTIPAGCSLIIKPGTWVILKKYVNINVLGELKVEGTVDEPIVITSENNSEPWGGMLFKQAKASFKYCIVLNGGGDLTKGHPTNEDWHTGHQHIFFGMDNSEFNFDQCFFLYSPGKVFGAQDSRVTVTNSVTSFVWLGGEFHRVLLSYTDSHLMNLPNDDHIYLGDIDTDGFHIDYINSKYPQYSVIDRCYFVTGKDDAIDHHYARLKISNCWLEDFMHEGVAASGGDTVKIFNTLALKNDQGFEAGWTENGTSKGPYVFVDHCTAVENNTGIRIGDSYDWTYKDYMKVTNSILYNNKDNVRNYLNSTHAPLIGALDISYSMTNDSDYDNSPDCITGVPRFDSLYYLLPGSTGKAMGMRGTDMGRADIRTVSLGAIVINEIMYKSPAVMDTKDWIELYNPTAESKDISGWVVKDNDNTHSFKVSLGTVIPAGGFQVISNDTSVFRQFQKEVKNLCGNISFGFGASDQVRLFDPKGQLMDSVAYQNTFPWPLEADGQGYSLILIKPEADHCLASSWSKSLQTGGSPGKANLLTATDTGNSGKNTPWRLALKQNYPNPFNPVTHIIYEIPENGGVRIELYNLLGQKIADLINNQNEQAGRYKIEFNGQHLPSGIYFYRIEFCNNKGDRNYFTKKMMLVK